MGKEYINCFNSFKILSYLENYFILKVFFVVDIDWFGLILVELIDFKIKY